MLQMFSWPLGTTVFFLLKQIFKVVGGWLVLVVL